MAQENKTCKICGEKGHSKFYCKKKPLKKAPVKSVKKPKKRTRSQLVKDMDNIFSRYIRLSRKEECVTCKDVKPWKELQNGHFFSRGRYPTRWDETNCHPQCYRCNVILNGNYINYTIYMIDTYGRDTVDELERKSQSGEKLSTPRLREMIAEYTDKVKELKGE